MPEEPELKRCSKCKDEKSIEEFGIFKQSKDGHRSMCFECKREYDRDSRIKQTGKTKAVPKPKAERKTDKVEAPKVPGKETIVQYAEATDAQFIKAFKKTTIKSFIKDDLIPMLEKIVQERFEQRWT